LRRGRRFVTVIDVIDTSITVTAVQNPFIYGEVVPGPAFVDRESELQRLIDDLGAGQKVFLISPRRYGKSSLIRQALGALTAAVSSPSRSPSAATARTWPSSKGTRGRSPRSNRAGIAPASGSST